MKQIRISTQKISCLLIVLLFTSCTNIDLDKIEDMKLDTSLGIPIGTSSITLEDIIETLDLNANGNIEIESDSTLSIVLDNQSIDYDFTLDNYNTDAMNPPNLEFAAINPFKDYFNSYPNSTFPFVSGEDISFSQNIKYDLKIDENIEKIKISRIDSCSIKSSRLNLNLILNDLNISVDNPINLEIEFIHIISSNSTTNTINTVITRNNFEINHLLEDFRIIYPQSSDVVFTPIKLKFTIPKNSQLLISKNSYISSVIKLDVDKVNYIYGFFEERTPLHHDKFNTELPANIFDNPILQNSKFLFSNPQLTLKITNTLGVPIQITCDSLYTEDNNGSRRYASFDGNTYFTKDISMPANIGDNVTQTIRLDRNFGNTNKLFEIIPKLINIKYIANIGQSNRTSHFFKNDSKLTFDITTKIPLMFDPNTQIYYKDTLEADIQGLLGAESFDINLNSVNISLNTENMIPLNLEANLVFIDENQQILYSSNNIKITSADVNSDGKAQKKSISKVNLLFENNSVDKIMNTKFIVIETNLTNKDNNSKINLELSNYLTYKVGLFINGGVDVNLNK